MIIATTTIEDITIALHDDHTVTRSQDNLGVFYRNNAGTLLGATKDYLDCVANEIALHAHDGMTVLSQQRITIEMPEF